MISKPKVSLLNKQLRHQFYSVLSLISVMAAIFVLFGEIPINAKTTIGISFLLILVIIYLALWFRANLLTQRKLHINNSTLEIKTGDIFKEEGLKVIAFNEYFDTKVDDTIIASKTLNGKFINNIVKNVQELDTILENDTHLKDKKTGLNSQRKLGKKQKYDLGTIFVYENEYLLTAFSHFDNENKAYLSMSDYLNFLILFWNEIDRVYASRSVVIPLLGSGITRFKSYNMIDDQELLEILIWTFKISRIKFTYPAKVSIIISEAKKDRINFYNLKEER